MLRPAYRLVRVPQTQSLTTLRTAHAPAGFTEAEPFVVGTHRFKGGQFIPPEALAQMKPEQLEKVVWKDDLDKVRKKLAAASLAQKIKLQGGGTIERTGPGQYKANLPDGRAILGTWEQLEPQLAQAAEETEPHPAEPEQAKAVPPAIPEAIADLPQAPEPEPVPPAKPAATAVPEAVAKLYGFPEASIPTSEPAFSRSPHF